MNRTVMDKVRSMMTEAWMKEGFRGKALYHATLLHNNTVTRTHQKVTPREALLCSMPNNFRIKIFGSAAKTHRHTTTEKVQIRL